MSASRTRLNLGLKLANVVHGSAPEEPLVRYERERWPIGEVLCRIHADAAPARFRPSIPRRSRCGNHSKSCCGCPRSTVVSPTRFPPSVSPYPKPLFAPDRKREHPNSFAGTASEQGTRAARLLADRRSIACLRTASGSGCNSPLTTLIHFRRALTVAALNSAAPLRA